ncbi:unnamed protein product [Aureobasidium vineae]|uniref:Uncharacterized protein n=1 Tax=Aureobasidium vineae TaxID=2773715 RepID=A0A9N8JBF0_9PEZI|nr:unnamed protein product [Aureobasidium vineae]
MPHSKTPGGAGMSDKEAKKQAQSAFCLTLYSTLELILTQTTVHGDGASNAAGHTEGKAPGEAPVASDSGVTNVGIDNGSNQPGEKGIKGVPVSTESTTNANMK